MNLGTTCYIQISLRYYYLWRQEKTLPTPRTQRMILMKVFESWYNLLHSNLAVLRHTHLMKVFESWYNLLRSNLAVLRHTHLMKVFESWYKVLNSNLTVLRHA